ncbi:MAG TPA: hypothetical protein VNU24_01085 [Solirubrobacteraceae bacterium]|jgi:hypothetical protein|nr:hypothetical protein [Solirubrobacteraceae bacterium]
MGWGAPRARAGCRLLAGLSLCVVLLAGGCGGVLSPDLFIVYRSGSSPGARLTMLVNEEGVVHCNGGPARHLSDPQIIEARTIQEKLEEPAAKHESLPAEPGSVLSYYLRDANGTVRFSDNSAHQPAAMRKLAAFVLGVAQGVCGLRQEGA